MENLGVVSIERLMESACRDELFIVHDEKRGVHKGKKTMLLIFIVKVLRDIMKDQVRINLIEN